MNWESPSPVDMVRQELRFALAQAHATEPPGNLRARVFTAALGGRPAGRTLDEPPEITPAEGYRRTVHAFHCLLGELGDEEWARPVLRGLSAQELVGHLIGVERAFQGAVGIESSTDQGPDHVASTQADAEAQRGRPPGDTRSDWHARCVRTLDHVATWSPPSLAEAIALHGFTLSVDKMLIVRAFEMWTHEEDVRRATGRPLVAPDASRLALMTRLAVAALPKGLDLTGRPRPERSARIVLTGVGGGAFQIPLGRVVESMPAVRIVADATSFCRLVANRVGVTELGAVVTGDQTLGFDVLAGAMALALD